MNTISTTSDARIKDAVAELVRTASNAARSNGASQASKSPQTEVVLALNPSDALDQKRSDQLEKLIAEINREYQARNIALQFRVDKSAGALVISVLDAANDKLIRQIPPDAILAIKRHMRSLLGDIFDAEA